MTDAKCWLGLGFLSLTLCACSEQDLSPEELPYSYEVVDEFYGTVYPHDLDGDQIDELIVIRHPYESQGEKLASLVFHASEGTVLQQINYPGIFLPPHFYDWNTDGYIDIIIPNLRNDSLFVILFDVTRTKIPSFFLTKGEPRISDGKTLPWDPKINNFFFKDINQNGNVELITNFRTDYAKKPRGIFIHSLPDGEMLGSVFVGASIRNGFFDDFDNDGVWEILAHSIATNNGASAGGFTDDKSYIINFELSLPPSVKWSENTGGLWSRSNIFYEDFHGDGRKVFLSSKFWLANYKKTTFEFIDPMTWKKIAERTFDGKVSIACLIDYDRDLLPEIMASSATGELMILDKKFELQKKRKMKIPPYAISSFPDLDGDGIQYLMVRTQEGRSILGSDLRIICSLPPHSPKIHPYTLSEFYVRRREQRPAILLNSGDKATIIRLKENPFYLFYRYGKPSLVIFGAFSVFSLIFGFVAYRNRYRRLRSIQETALQSDQRGVVLLQPDGRIQSHNTSFARLFELPEDKDLAGQKLIEIVKLPELAAFLRAAARHPALRRSTKLVLDRQGNQRIIRLELEPVSPGLPRKPVWLLIFANQTQETEYIKARSWQTMSQRMQLEYRDRIPRELQAALDEYTHRNIDQIENLRRVTRNFMKLVDLEKPNLLVSDFSEMMKAECSRIKAELPFDIALNTNLTTENVTTRIDEEQLHELFKNLVSNAVNAMLDGGVMTITTQIERGLYLAQSAEARDFAIVEFKDTGHGIPENRIAEIFEPKFTTSENGSGLGLAIVKKIVDLHGAHLEVESQVGAGTIFTIYLPIAD